MSEGSLDLRIFILEYGNCVVYSHALQQGIIVDRVNLCLRAEQYCATGSRKRTSQSRVEYLWANSVGRVCSHFVSLVIWVFFDVFKNTF